MAKTVVRKKLYKVKWHIRKTVQFDYLKNYRIVRKWAMRRYNLPYNDLELILALYSESLFTVTKFKVYCETYTWDRGRLQRLIDGEFVHIFRKRQANEPALYELTTKARRMCASIYKKLNGDEVISEHPTHNPYFRLSAKDSCYADMKMQIATIRMNKENKKTHLV